MRVSQLQSMQNDTVWKNECDGTKTDMFALQRERERERERKVMKGNCLEKEEERE
jgi:hypothetical protein